MAGMARQVALLRGVNVGGVTIRNLDLVTVFTDLGFGAVRPVLASGNVVFESSEPVDTARSRIEAALSARFGYEAWVHVIEADRLHALVDAYPFTEGAERHAYVVFTLSDEARDLILSLSLDPALESVAPGDGCVYWTVEKGSTLTSTVGRACAPTRFRSVLTTRNMNTLRRLR